MSRIPRPWARVFLRMGRCRWCSLTGRCKSCRSRIERSWFRSGPQPPWRVCWDQARRSWSSAFVSCPFRRLTRNRRPFWAALRRWYNQRWSCLSSCSWTLFIGWRYRCCRFLSGSGRRSRRRFEAGTRYGPIQGCWRRFIGTWRGLIASIRAFSSLDGLT